jgi:diguanylate cyclase (GGDEF)-like protein
MRKLGSGLAQDIGEKIDQDELKGFARSVAEVEWLLLILVLLYLLAPGTSVDERELMIGGLVGFAGFILAFRYLNFYRQQTRLKIAIETLVMVGFTTAVMIPTGGTDSPLVNLYLLPIIVAALTLGKWYTLLMVGLVSLCYVYAGVESGALLSMASFSGLMAKLSPFVLVAFITTMLSGDIHIARNRIRVLSETDALTGLVNMRAFSRIQRREHARAERYDRTYAVLLLDMDNLKAINDRYGHEAGNRAIVLVANVITRVIRNTDIAARFGGDEFVVLLAETNAKEAEEVARRIRSSISNTTLDYRGNIIRTSTSVGIATYPRDSSDAKELIVQADREMYRVKELGRSPVAEGSGTDDGG